MTPGENAIGFSWSRIRTTRIGCEFYLLGQGEPECLWGDSCSLRRSFVSVACLRAHSGLTLWDPMDWCSLPGFSVHGILQARILKWVAISSSGESSWPRDWTTSLYLLQWQADSLPLHLLGSLSCLGSLKWAVPGMGFYIHLSNWVCLMAPCGVHTIYRQGLTSTVWVCWSLVDLNIIYLNIALVFIHACKTIHKDSHWLGCEVDLPYPIGSLMLLKQCFWCSGI